MRGAFLVRETKLSKSPAPQDLPLFQLWDPVPPLALLTSVQTVFLLAGALRYFLHMKITGEES